MYWLKSRSSPSFSNPECRKPMSGTALTTVSPSSVRMRRNVVCVAGSCRPKLRVYRKSMAPHPSRSSTDSSCSSGIESALRPRDRGEVVALQASAQRVVLAQRVRREAIGHQDPPQVRMALENHAVHVVRLALHPVGPLPQGEA